MNLPLIRLNAYLMENSMMLSPRSTRYSRGITTGCAAWVASAVASARNVIDPPGPADSVLNYLQPPAPRLERIKLPIEWDSSIRSVTSRATWLAPVLSVRALSRGHHGCDAVDPGPGTHARRDAPTLRASGRATGTNVWTGEVERPL